MLDAKPFLNAIAVKGQPDRLFSSLEEMARASVGVKLFTVMAYDSKTRLAHRQYTSHPIEYPVKGAKPLSEGGWSNTVIERQQPFVANNIEDISTVFPDFELIDALGCQSVVNVPALFDGDVIGTLNLLHEAGFYTPERVKAALAFGPYAAMALLAARASND